jgi:hypothetical protein
MADFLSQMLPSKKKIYVMEAYDSRVDQVFGYIANTRLLRVE